MLSLRQTENIPMSGFRTPLRSHIKAVSQEKKWLTASLANILVHTMSLNYAELLVSPLALAQLARELMNTSSLKERLKIPIALQKT